MRPLEVNATSCHERKEVDITSCHETPAESYVYRITMIYVSSIQRIYTIQLGIKLREKKVLVVVAILFAFNLYPITKDVVFVFYTVYVLS